MPSRQPRYAHTHPLTLPSRRRLQASATPEERHSDADGLRLSVRANSSGDPAARIRSETAVRTWVTSARPAASAASGYRSTPQAVAPAPWPLHLGGRSGQRGERTFATRALRSSAVDRAGSALCLRSRSDSWSTRSATNHPRGLPAKRNVSAGGDSAGGGNRRSPSPLLTGVRSPANARVSLPRTRRLRGEQAPSGPTRHSHRAQPG